MACQGERIEERAATAEVDSFVSPDSGESFGVGFLGFGMGWVLLGRFGREGSAPHLTWRGLGGVRPGSMQMASGSVRVRLWRLTGL